jgi:hypothetical protein
LRRSAAVAERREEIMTWQKGQSGNPAGRPKGARNLLSESVLKELIGHWEENGLDAIDRTCKEQRAAYLRAVLSLVPKDFAMTVERDEMPQHIEVRFVD